MPVSSKDRGAANEEFPVLGKFQFDVGERLADGTHAVVGSGVEGDDGRSFGEAVTLPDGDSDGGEPSRGIDAQRSAAGDKDFHAAAEGFADLGIHQFAGQLPHRGGGLAPAVGYVRVGGADADGPGEHALFDGRLRGAAFDFLTDFFVDAGYADKDRGFDLAHGLGELVELGTIGYLRAAVVHDVVEGTRGDVREGQKGDAGIRGIEVEFIGGVVLIGGDVAVGQHDPFGLAGSP